MVNKQYIIQNPKFFKPKNHQLSPLNHATFPIISSTPNPPSSLTSSISANNNLDTISEEQITFARNTHQQNNEHTNDINCDRLNPGKDISINDIGRFQYILQMDREMNTHPETLYPALRPSNNSNLSSNSNSLNSNIHFKFWKAGTQKTSKSSTKIYTYLRLLWHYGKWPVALLLILSILAVVIYFLTIETEMTTEIKNKKKILYNNNLIFETTNNNNYIIRNIEETNTQSVINGHAGNYNNLTILDENIRSNETEGFFEMIRNTTNKNHATKQNELNHLTIFVEASSTEQYANDEGTPTFFDKVTDKARDYEDITRTTINKNNEETTPHLSSLLKSSEKKRKLIFPTKETLEMFGFTSGHQNNFGIPIEEDERILRLLNEQIINNNKNNSKEIATTDSSIYRTRVSPTLPILQKYEITTEGLIIVNITDDGFCQSTSLPLCRGILHYDLTSGNLNRLSSLETENFQYLIDSQCSLRVAEFVCAVLEPECRPKQMGTLKPCKRICKSVLEPCAHIIASSEVLTTTFDCDSYPDSNNRNECEDPTRRSKCYENEIQCSDTTCIPLQWKCDNIKDCSQGEDENDCKFCEHDEFRCQTNDKCIPDKWRCDRYDDCPDASDELDCFEDESRTFPTSYGTSRTFPFAHEQLPGNPNTRLYLTISGDDRINSAERKIDEEDDTILPTGAEIISTTLGDINQTKADEEIQKSSASGRIILNSKSLGNFQDSKEIMMTSDSEADYKYSSTDQSTLTTSHASPCPHGELRCISGRCITISQLCDKVSDCSDGADEAMCLN